MVTVTIPLCAHLITIDGGGRTETPGWDRGHFLRALEIASGIWSPADIRFRPRSVNPVTVRLPGTGNTTVDRSAFFFLASRFGRRPETSVALVRRLSDSSLGGRSREALNFCLIPYTARAESAGKHLAHEMGHLLGLEHPDGARGHGTRSHVEASSHVYNLMYSGLSADTRLTEDQIRAARGSRLARRFGGS